MLVSDSLQFGYLVAACEEDGRYEFMVSGSRFGFPVGQIAVEADRELLRIE